MPERPRFARSPASATLASIVLGVALWVLVPPPASAQAITFFAFGDSLTYGFGDDGVDCEIGPKGGWPVPLRQRMNGRGLSTAVINRGICGETTLEGLTRLRDLLETSEGEAVILQEGTNDLSKPSISVESTRFNLLSMVQATRDAGLVPLLSSPPPRATDDSASNRTGFLASQLTEDAITFDIPYTNQYDLLLEITDVFERFYADDLHPNAIGYEIMADNYLAAALEVVQRINDGGEEEPPPFGCFDENPSPCVVDDETLCLNDGRFAVSVSWRDFEGLTGVGTAVPLTSDTGFFWFFDSANLELVLKVLDGRPVNDAFWVFYGALSNVEYMLKVVDSETGECKEYSNPLGEFASVGDTSAFPQLPDGGGGDDGGGDGGDGGGDGDDGGGDGDGDGGIGSGGLIAPVVERLPFPALEASAAAAAAPKGTECVEDDLHLCLNDDRFRVSATWTDFEGNTGEAQAVPRTTDTGTFWFFDESNVELVLKVLDGTGVNGFYWIFYGALSNVAYEITVVDTVTGEEATYENPLGDFASRADIEAFLGS